MVGFCWSFTCSVYLLCKNRHLFRIIHLKKINRTSVLKDSLQHDSEQRLYNFWNLVSRLGASAGRIRRAQARH